MSSVQKQFETFGFKFKKEEEVRGSQNLVGTYPTGAYVQIIGPAAKPSEQSLVVPAPSTDRPILDEGVKFIKEFLALTVPKPNEAELWIKDNLKVAVEKGFKRLDQVGKKIYLRGKSTNDGAVVAITVSPK